MGDELKDWLPEDEEIILRRLACWGYLEGTWEVQKLKVLPLHTRGLVAVIRDRFGFLYNEVLCVGQWLVKKLGGPINA